jgi:putative tricarboxylic transport membrane protein
LGTFTVNGSIIEVGIMLAAGVLGFFMRRYGMSPAALVIALVLGPLAEETLRQTMVISGGDLTIFLQRTTSMWLLIAIAVLLLIPFVIPLVKRFIAVRTQEVGRRRQTQERAEDTDESTREAAGAGVTHSGSEPDGPDRTGDQAGPR